MKHAILMICILIGFSSTFAYAACEQNRTLAGTCTANEISQKMIGTETSSCGACPPNKLCKQDLVVQYATTLTKRSYRVSFMDPADASCPCPPAFTQCSEEVISRDEPVEIGQRLENLRCVEFEQSTCYYKWTELPGSECSGTQVNTNVVSNDYAKFQIDGEWYYYVLLRENTYRVIYTRYVATEVHNCGNGKPCTLEKIEGIFRCGTPEKSRKLIESLDLRKGPYKY